jgi:two-component sensor histidine kinase
MAYEVVLIVNELVTNAVVHTVGSVMLTLDVKPESVRVVVSDSSDTLPRQRAQDLSAVGGRGLALVAAMSDDWGVHERDGGKVVWADVPIARGLVAREDSAG